MSRPVLVVTAGGSVQSLWARLGQTYDLAVPTQQMAQALQSQGVAAMSVQEFFGPGESEAAATETARFVARAVAGTPALDARLAPLYGDGRPDALNGHFRQWWPGYLLQHAQQVVSRITALDNLASQRQVAGCVVHEDLTPDMRTLVLWARARGVPSVHVPHAPCHLLPGVPDVHRETRTDHIAAAGQQVAAFYRGCGTQAGITVTGAPHLDGLYTGVLPPRGEARRVLAIDSDALVIVYASTWAQTTSLRSGFDFEMRAGLAAVMAAAKQAGAVLIVKMHPGEPQQSEARYAEAMKAAGVGGMVTRQHTWYVLRAADAVVAQGPSNICVESAILGTPSAYIQTEGFDYAANLPFRSSAPGVAEALAMALESRGAPEWQEFARQYNDAHPDGGAGERTAQFVESVCPA